MKKLCAGLIGVLVLCSTVSAVDFGLSAGVGGIFTAGWKDAELKDEYKAYTQSLFATLGGLALPDPADASTLGAINKGYFDTKETSLGGGIWAFFDATYAELDAALIWNNISQKVNSSKLDPTGNTKDEEPNYLITQLNISILGKYPFEIGKKLQIFPLLGADFQIALTDQDDKIAKDIKSAPGNNNKAPSLGDFWNSLWIKAGVGADYSITEDLYLRCEVLYGIKFNSKYDDDEAKYWTEDLKGVKNGPDVRLGLGYRFKTFGK
ncbi:hypothetical protein LQZ19_10240 [Treponema primitia]|uniref:hypothetical protein n=1 Tax=Treponema primitia TaxID=88058 RepID=UPI00397FC96D